MKKKLLAILLTVCMVISMAPAALAEKPILSQMSALTTGTMTKYSMSTKMT